MDSKTLLNSIGLLLTIIGVYVAYKNSPMNFDTIDGGNPATDFNEIKRITKKRNNWLRNGVYLVLFGSGLQLMSNLIPQ